MIRFAVLILFFIHLAILMKAPFFKWLGRILGGGVAGLFLFLYVMQVEENSDLVFLVTAILAGGSILLAEILATLLKNRQNSA